MSESAITAAQAFVEVVNRHDVDALAELMTENHRIANPQ
jgi:ketosteroid isomerase-like protein